MMNRKIPHPTRHATMTLPIIFSLLCAGCVTAPDAPGNSATSAAPINHASQVPVMQGTHLLALLPMREGYGPGDHDAYEARIARFSGEHGMVRDSAYTVSQFLGGNAGPRNASTVGVWSLKSAESVQAVMSDPRYQAQVEYRNKIHAMADAQMYMVKQEFSGRSPSSGHVLLVGALVMNQGFDFEAHDSYEKTIAPIGARYGMQMYRSYRVLQQMGAPGPSKVVAVNIWELPNPDALGKVMSDPDYVAQVPVRNRIHDMKATTMYFVAPRTAS